MKFSEILILVQNLAEQHGLDADLATAIMMVESGGNPLAVRYEPHWSYVLNAGSYAQANGISEITERVLQSMSYGPMQVMGTVCRELGFSGALLELTDPALSLKYAMKKLEILAKKYENEAAMISAYNAGSPKKRSNGQFENQVYVDKVLKRLKTLRDLH